MQNKGFFGSLFDLSFTEFVTTRVIKFLYVIAIIVAALVALLVVITGFSSGVGGGLVALILSPVVFVLYVLLARIWLEVVIVLFRIAENTGRMAEQCKSPGA